MSEKYQHIVIKKDGKVMESYIQKIEAVREVEDERRIVPRKELHEN